MPTSLPKENAPRVDAAVVLLAMGGPRERAEVRPFLEELFSDPEMIRLPRPMRRFQPRLARWIARRRSRTVEEKYVSIGGSPLVATTAALAEQVSVILREEGLHVVALAGMRYGALRAPAEIRRVLQPIAAACPGLPVVLLPQYPFYSEATSASSIRDAEGAVRGLGLRPVPVPRFGDHEDHVDLMVALTRRSLQEIPAAERNETHLLVSVHGLPERYVRSGDPYRDEVGACVETLRLRLKDDIPSDRIHLSFQSRVGPVKWIGPATDETIVRLGRDGVRHLLVVPLGFTCDHLETLEEIDLLYRDLAMENGFLSFTRVPTPGLDPRYVRLQTRLVREHLALDRNGRGD